MREIFFFILGMNLIVFVLYIINKTIRKEIIKYLEWLDGATIQEQEEDPLLTAYKNKGRRTE